MASTSDPKRDDGPPEESGSASREPAPSIATSQLARSVEQPASEAVPSTELDPHHSDAPPATHRTAPASGDVRVPRLAPVHFDQEATLESHGESGEALRLALDARLAEAAAEHAAAHAGAGDDLDGETATDLAPVGPTEALVSGPPSDAAPPRVAAPAAEPPTRDELERQIRELEARLDSMMKKEPAPRAPEPPPPPGDVHQSPFVQQHWGKDALRSRGEDVDEFGHDPSVEARWLPAIEFLRDVYFRVETTGAEHVPATGRCLVVANHSGGTLPYDGLMLRAVLRREHERHRELRWLAEDFIYYLPFVGATMNRLGAVRACQENAERLLAKGSLVAVFPEGAKGIGKLYKERYRLQRFGRGGFIRLALRTQTPLVPCAIVGAEEANPLLYRVEGLAKALGVPYLPVTPTFPALGPLGLLPAPTKWKIELGPPLSFGGYGPEAADDDLLVGRLADQVRATIQGMVDRSVSGRRSIWFG